MFDGVCLLLGFVAVLDDSGCDSGRDHERDIPVEKRTKYVHSTAMQLSLPLFRKLDTGRFVGAFHNLQVPSLDLGPHTVIQDLIGKFELRELCFS